MSRREFTKATKRAALVRSGGLCEAIGTLYGLEPNQRCNTWKNNHHDTPRAAKGLRQQDKHNGISRAKKPIPSRPFRQGKGNIKQLRDL